MNSHNQQRRILLDCIIIFLFLLFILFPEINRQLLIIPDIPSVERRTLASLPVLNIRNISIFIKQFDRFYNDHFGFRVRLVAANTFLHASLFGLSTVPFTIIGKDGWLFINRYRPTDPMTFAGWQGYRPYCLDQLKAIRKNLESEKIWFSEKNITFLILPAPEKNSIYPEYLLRRFETVVGPSRRAQIFAHMKLHSKLELIDLRQVLLTAKKSHQLDLYFKSDSHWNTIGAFFAYEEIMKRLLFIDPHFIPYRLEDFIQDRQLKYVGDLARTANLDVSHILEHQLLPKPNISYEKRVGRKKYKLLIFGDSFTRYFLKNYLQGHFDDVKHIRSELNAFSKLNKSIVLKYQPDVVIWESVERNWVRR